MDALFPHSSPAITYSTRMPTESIFSCKAYECDESSHTNSIFMNSKSKKYYFTSRCSMALGPNAYSSFGYDVRVATLRCQKWATITSAVKRFKHLAENSFNVNLLVQLTQYSQSWPNCRCEDYATFTHIHFVLGKGSFKLLPPLAEERGHNSSASITDLFEDNYLIVACWLPDVHMDWPED